MVHFFTKSIFSLIIENMELANKTIYQVFVRNYSPQGDFRSLENDLPRIRDLGIDILYLMPIHKIGEIGRKGTYGSPYSIQDYYSISPDLGTLEDFVHLVESVHAIGMEIILDMVFNHTARDSILFFFSSRILLSEGRRNRQ